MNKILLSICIPTYNRAEYLKATINSIVKQETFFETEEIEIVISDNCSTDNTKELVYNFIEKYGSKITYNRNPENILDSNFEKVLSLGKGKLLKLNNDTLLYKEDSIKEIIKLIKKYHEKKDILFFTSRNLKNISTIHLNDLDSFVRLVSYLSTWIGSFSIWREDFNSLKDFNRNKDLNLVQTDVLLRLISKKKSVVLCNLDLFEIFDPKSKGGYNIFKVLLDNYLTLLYKYVLTGELSMTTFKLEKHKMLINYILPWYYTLVIKRSNKHYFETKGFFLYFFKYFNIKDLLVFYIRLIKKIIDRILFKMRRK